MNLDYSPEDIEFRMRARAWLEDHVPKKPRPSDTAAAGAYDRAWQCTLYDHGWAGVNWPKEYGGLGLSSIRQMIWFEECARARAPAMNSVLIALMHGGPTLIARGTPEQKAFHLPKILKGESVWCQGFSESGAGSDLAALKTRGVVEGDELVVNGQKMWTSFAHYAEYQELLVRTDPDSRRHQGLTWVICDMKSPGIEIRPLRNMMGEHHVNMVFYDNVRIPLTNIVGEIGNGWSVAMSTFAFERGITFLPEQIEMLEKVQRLIEIARKSGFASGTSAQVDIELSRKLARLKADTLALRAMTVTSMSEIERTGQPGPEASLLKLFVTTTYKALSELAAEVLGWRFLEYGNDRTSNFWTYEFMWSWVLTIAGGSSQIQREIIADRVLGLPRSR
jgi:alkylation response protein AidB-like acyl-CoA dehydrogenase